MPDTWTLTNGASSIIFNSLTADGDGNTWLITEHQGWDSPQFESKAAGRTNAHGGAVTPAYLPPRPVVIDGFCKTSSVTSSRLGRAKLQSVAALLAPVIGQLAGPGPEAGDLTLDVHLAGQVKIRLQAQDGSFTFQIPLIAPFPIRRGTATTVGALTAGTSTLTNAGNAPYPWNMVTSGNVNFFNAATLGGSAISATGLAAGTVIDSKDKTILTSLGVSVYDKLDINSSEWWWVLPGANSVTYAGGTAVLTYYNGWW